MSFLGDVYKMCLDREEKRIKDEREFQLKLAVTPRTININFSADNIDNSKPINPIVVIR